MEIRTLRYFLTTAEELHVGRAAERLGIAQPALSQQIRSLEARLQVRLFNRAHRKITLTDAGRVFLGEAKLLMSASERAVRVTREADRGAFGQLNIGYVGSAIFDPLLQMLLRRFMAAYPNVSLVMHESTPERPLEALSTGYFDIALVRGRIGKLLADVERRPFTSSRLVLALPAGHPFVGRDHVHLQEMRDANFIALNDPPATGLADSLHQACQRAGFIPNIALQAGSVMSVLALVGAGFGVTLVPELPPEFLSSTFVLRPLDDPQAQTEIVLLTRKRIDSAIEGRFIAMANQMIEVQAGLRTGEALLP
jgi:DNA-binding transcriptional LysR family regulator